MKKKHTVYIYHYFPSSVDINFFTMDRLYEEVKDITFKEVERRCSHIMILVKNNVNNNSNIENGKTKSAVNGKR